MKQSEIKPVVCGMIRKIFLLSLLSLLLHGYAVAQIFDKFLSGYNKVEGAELIEISGKELAVLSYSLPEHQKSFYRLVDKMITFSMKKCVPAERERFYAGISAFSPEGYFFEEHKAEGSGRTKLFFKFNEKKGVCTEIVVAALDDKLDVSLTILKGKFRLDDIKVMFD